MLKKIFRILTVAGIFCIPLVYASPSDPIPNISTVNGILVEGETITIKGTGFTTKTNQKPLLFWSADTGLLPAPSGRKLSWDSTFNGTLVDRQTTGNIAPGSRFALRHDFSASSSAILSRVSFNSDQLYVWRKRLDDFDRSKDYAIRARYNNLTRLSTTPTPSVGMIVSNTSKTVYGRINKHEISSTTIGTFYFANDWGNIANKSLGSTVKSGELLLVYAADDTNLSQPIFSVNSNEGVGIYYTFNHKIFRLWGKYGTYPNNSYISVDSDGMMVSENTQVRTFNARGWDNIIYTPTKRWAIEEFEYQAGTVDTADGTLNFWQDRVKAWETQRFRFTTSTHPNKYSDLYQGQVSNGAQPNSFTYYDALYVDDTFHRVLVCDSATWSQCTKPEIILPFEWTDESIKANLRKGQFFAEEKLYFYVTNSFGNVNENGFLFCPRCPTPPKSL